MRQVFSSFFGKPETRYLLAIDIGSGTTIRSLSLEVRADGPDPRMLAKRHVRLPTRADTPSLIAHIRDRVRHLIFQTLRELGRLPREVSIGLGSHFTFNVTERLSYERSDPTRPVTAGELEAFLAEHLQRQKIRHAGAETYRLAVSTPLLVEIDGYPVETLSGQSRGRLVEIALINTYALAPFGEELERLSSFLGGLTVTLIANQSAIAGAIRNILNLADALIVKVGAVITEVTLLRSGRIVSTGQFPSGGNDVTVAISRELSIPFSEAERLKLEWGVALFSPDTRARAERAIRRAAGEWASELVRYLSSQSDALILPETVFLLGGGAKSEALKQTLASQQWFSGLTFLPRLSVVRLDAKDLMRNLFSTTTPPCAGPEEVALASLVWRLLKSPKLVLAGPI